jgi:hypothetical protein
VGPVDLFAGDGEVRVSGEGTIFLAAVRSMFSEPEQMARPPVRLLLQWARKTTAEIAAIKETVPSGVFLATATAMTEADIRIGRSLGWSREWTAGMMAARWGHPLSIERDRRAGPGANAQRRGQISRALKNELKKGMQ